MVRFFMKDNEELLKRMKENVGIKKEEQVPQKSSSASNIISKLTNAKDRGSMPSKDEINAAIGS